MANYTQKAIMQTFEAMLADMPFEKITVSAIVAGCEISSNTFYYHYRDIYDLLDKWLEEKKERFLKDTDLQSDFASRLKTILHMMQEKSQIVYHIFGSISRERLERYIFTSAENAVYDYIRLRAEGTDITDDVLRDISGFCCYSILGFVIKFIWMRMDIDVDPAVDRLTDTFGGMLEYTIMRANSAKDVPDTK